MGKSDLETENMKDSSLNLENTDPQGLTPTSKANNTAQTPGTQEQAKEISSEDQKPTQELALKDELNLTEFEKSLIKPLQEKLKNSANDLNLEKNSSEDLNLNINSQDELNLEKVSANDLNLDTNLSEDLNLDSVKEDVKTSSEEASLEKTVSKEAANLAEDLNEDLNLQLSEGDLNSKADSTEGLNEDLNSGSSSKEGLNEDLNLDLNEESLKEGLNDDLNLEDLNSKLAKQDPSLEDTKSTNQATQPTKEPDPSLEFKEEDLLLNEDLKEENSAKELEELKIDELSLQEELNLQEGLNSKEDLDQKLNLAELQEDLTDTEANDKNNDEMGLDGVEAIKDLIDEEPNKQEEELIDPSLSTEDEAKQIKASESIKDLIDEEPNKQEEELTVEEVPLNQDLKEDRLSFDDLPRDAKFIGQNKETPQLDELTPTVEEPQEPQTEELSTHDKIKNELAILNEMDKMEAKEEESLKDEPSEDKQAKIIKTLEEVNEAPLRMQRISAINLEEDLAQLNERDIQIALKEVPTQDEETQPPPQSTQDLQEKSAQNEEIIDELSKGIAGAITSSIKDDALKAALKGMNMHIDINIKFEEDKQ
ncbi:hypothetical protein [Campylobacter troglodytis]|uniref:hypothetical protein n=1 Tax=Campylobacter troglodytis TaxID=654363 RepID=UPI003D040864